MKKSDYHEPVMVREVIEALHINKGSLYVDATVSTGGHAVEIVRRGGKVLGIDMDPQMLKVAERRLEGVIARPSFKLVHGNFKDIDVLAKENGFDKVSGILFDLGVSNIHLTSPNRGFSFENPDAPLDMRIDSTTQGVTGADLLTALRKDQLIDLFRITMEPGSARWLVNRLIEERERISIKTVGDFLRISQGLRGKPGLNPATLPFLALRIAVNSELENLAEALPKAYELLLPSGRLVVISFHSGEDAIVKRFFKESPRRILTEKPILPEEGEVEKNPRARSAKMRVLEKP